MNDKKLDRIIALLEGIGDLITQLNGISLLGYQNWINVKKEAKDEELRQ